MRDRLGIDQARIEFVLFFVTRRFNVRLWFASCEVRMSRMRPLLQHASRLLSTHVAPVTSQRSGSIAFGSLAARSSTPPSICLRCQFRASSLHTERRQRDEDGISRRNWPRAFSSTRNHQEKESPVKPTKPPPQLEPAPEETPEVEDAKPPPKSTTPSEDTIARVPAEDLPSHKEGQRWDLSKRASEIMDELLPKLAQVTHKVNTYTGTDYSSIEALRREIMEQGKQRHSHPRREG
jgi:sensitive to high expression protein 9, mitochondrial